MQKSIKIGLFAYCFFFWVNCEQSPFDQSVQLVRQASSLDSLRVNLVELMKMPDRRVEDLKFTQKILSEEEDYTLYRVVIIPQPGDSIPMFFLNRDS